MPLKAANSNAKPDNGATEILIQMRCLSWKNPPFRISFSQQQSEHAFHTDNSHGSDNNCMFPLPVGLSVVHILTDNGVLYNWGEMLIF